MWKQRQGFSRSSSSHPGLADLVGVDEHHVYPPPFHCGEPDEVCCQSLSDLRDEISAVAESSGMYSKERTLHKGIDVLKFVSQGISA